MGAGDSIYRKSTRLRPARFYKFNRIVLCVILSGIFNLLLAYVQLKLTYYNGSYI
jgi:hypothetical protein